MTTRTLKTVARSFKAQVNGEETARMKAAALAFEYVVTLGGKAADLASDSGVSPGKVSKHVTAGKALALVPDASDDDKRSIIRTAHGEAGDRPAFMEALKAESAAGVVAASNAVPETDKKKSGKGKGSKASKTVSLKDMDTEALIALMGEALEVVAQRDDIAGENADRLVKFAKAATVIGKNVAALPVA